VAASHKQARPNGHARAHAAAKRRRRIARLAIPAAGLLTLVGISTVVVFNNSSSPVVAKASAGDKHDLIAAALESDQQLSRSAERAPLPNEAEAEKLVTGHMYVIDSDAVDVYANADDTSPVLAVLAPGDKVAVTGEKQKGWTQIVHKSLPRWVKSSGLNDQEPLGTKPCANGSGVEAGLQPDTVRVYRAVCAKFPSISRYGGRSGGGEHATGQALDIMVGNGNPIGNDVAAFLQKNRAKLGIEYLIWKQRIWRPATSAGWRGMSNRGSPTANHMDHVHVTTYGNSGTA
jgi:hypothetical protein